MSWSVTGTGDPPHLHEILRRTAHHYWGHLTANDKGAVAHVIGHALSRMDPSHLYSLSASGHGDERHYDLTLRLDRIEPSELPPPIPEEPPARASDLAREADQIASET